MDYLQPPQYCPDALATDVGWINPKNGELLIAVRNLRQKLADRDAQLNKIPVVAVDDRSTTQKILDQLTAQTIASPVADDRTETQKVLDSLTEKTTGVTISGGRNLTLVIDDSASIKEVFGAPPAPAPEDVTQESEPVKRGRGRPRKVKTDEKE